MFCIASNDAKLVLMTSCDQPWRKNPRRELPKIASRLAGNRMFKFELVQQLYTSNATCPKPAFEIAADKSASIVTPANASR